jgi:hypothetical protein
MGWESRRGRGRYYTRSRKVNGRVVREYVGGGLVGALAAREDETRRRMRDAERAALEADRDAFEAAAAAHDAFARAADALMTAALVAAGYHRHDRGQWRKRRAIKAEQ